MGGVRSRDSGRGRGETARDRTPRCHPRISSKANTRIPDDSIALSRVYRSGKSPDGGIWVR